MGVTNGNRRCRIRPPGCTDSAKYSWKTFTGERGQLSASAPALLSSAPATRRRGSALPPADADTTSPAFSPAATAPNLAAAASSTPTPTPAATATPTPDLTSGDFKTHKVIEHGKYKVPIKVKTHKDGLHVVKIEIQFPQAPSVTPLMYAMRWAVPEFTYSKVKESDKMVSEAADPMSLSGTFERSVKMPNFLESRDYKLKKTVVEANDTSATVLVEMTEDTPSCENQVLYDHIKVENKDGTIFFTIHELNHWGGIIPVVQVNRFNYEHLARMALRMNGLMPPTKKQDNMLLGDIAQNDESEKIANEYLAEFAAECEDKGYEFQKDIWSKKLNANLPFSKKAKPETNYDSYRSEQVLDMTMNDVMTVIEHIPEPGPVKKALTPECDDQGVLVDEATLKLAFKVDKIGPWPLAKREFLFLSVIGWAKDGTMYFCHRSTTDPRFKPNTSNCVGLFHSVGFRVKPSPCGKKVTFMQVLHCDPNKLPVSLVDVAMADKMHNIAHFYDLNKTVNKWKIKEGGVMIKK